MLPPELSASHRPLPLHLSKSALHALRRAPQLSALVLVGTGSFPANRVVARQRRGCFFGRHRVWSSRLDPSFQRYLERRRKALKHRYAEALHRKSFWEGEPNRPTRPFWKLSSSWGVPLRDGNLASSRPGVRWASSDDGTPQGAKDDPGGRRQDDGTRRGRLERRMEEIRRMVDEDPFRALFGYRMRNLSRYSSDGAREDLSSLLNWGRRSCSVIMSRFSARDRSGQDGVGGRAGASESKSDIEGNDRTNAASEDSSKRRPDRSSPQATTTDEFEFDPITMRRVAKRAKADLDAVDSAPGSHELLTEIFEKPPSGYGARSPTPLGAVTAHEDPVDAEPSKYTPASSSDGAHLPSNPAPPTEQPQDTADAKLSKYRAKNSRLEREGSTGRNAVPKSNNPSPSKSIDAGAPSLSPTDIPKVRDFEIPPEPPFEGSQASAKPSQFLYDSSGPQVEDLDLLTPSDVRSSAGILRGRDAEAPAEKQQDRERLEDEFRKIARREDSCFDEAEAMKVLQKSRDRQGATPGKDESDAVPWIQEATRSQDVAVEEAAAVEGLEGDIYDRTPQGLETCYDREIKAQRALLQEADGYDETPQGLEMSYVREAEQKRVEEGTDGHGKAPRRLQTSLNRKVEDQAVSGSSEPDIYGYATRPTGLETSYTREMEGQKEQTEDKTQRPELAWEANDGFAPGVEDGPVQTAGAESSSSSSSSSSTQREYSIWENKNPKRAAEESTRQRDKDLAKEIKAIYEDTYGVIDAEHRMQPLQNQKASDEVSSETSADEVPDRNLNVKPLDRLDESRNTSGDDGWEAEVLAQSPPPPTPIPIPIPQESNIPEHHRAEELATRREEQEQILHEEVKEVDDFLHDVQSELDAIKAKSPSPAHANSYPVVYKIIAYDPATNKLTSGSTTSSTDSEILSPSEVIPRLTNPAKFLPSLTALRKEGYEIVSGGKNVLVFKRVHEGPFIEEEDPLPDEHLPPPSHLTSSSLYPHVNPIDGTTVTGNFASPTGFVNHDSIFSSPFTDTDTLPLQEEPPPPPSPQPSPSSTSPSPSSPSSSPLPLFPSSSSSPPSPPSPSPLAAARSPTDKVRREEAVFSGKSKWQHQDVTHYHQQQQQQQQQQQSTAEPNKEKVKKAAKRVFWVGLWVAACSYAVGVTGEFFRTGGADGAGPQWFSGFH
ncbi:hypothetical protein GP486_007572 [Trichoglossum hirsutum]|uniref:Uncharacterized protein n=1 Tax=Trichoglossum hirsutum TaxID=265104 RepID=A0A9P8IBL0_9PEZI|nr:hypothetical protein GP486_007572 [Trichoglossum hirsutum]